MSNPPTTRERISTALIRSRHILWRVKRDAVIYFSISWVWRDAVIYLSISLICPKTNTATHQNHISITEGYHILSAVITPIQLLILAASITPFLLLRLLMNQTRIGKAMTAAADNPPGASVAGINPEKASSPPLPSANHKRLQEMLDSPIYRL